MECICNEWACIEELELKTVIFMWSPSVIRIVGPGIVPLNAHALNNTGSFDPTSEIGMVLFSEVIKLNSRNVVPFLNVLTCPQLKYVRYSIAFGCLLKSVAQFFPSGTELKLLSEGVDGIWDCVDGVTCVVGIVGCVDGVSPAVLSTILLLLLLLALSPVPPN